MILSVRSHQLHLQSNPFAPGAIHFLLAGRARSRTSLSGGAGQPRKEEPKADGGSGEQTEAPNLKQAGTLGEDRDQPEIQRGAESSHEAPASINCRIRIEESSQGRDTEPKSEGQARSPDPQDKELGEAKGTSPHRNGRPKHSDARYAAGKEPGQDPASDGRSRNPPPLEFTPALHFGHGFHSIPPRRFRGVLLVVLKGSAQGSDNVPALPNPKSLA